MRVLFKAFQPFAIGPVNLMVLLIAITVAGSLTCAAFAQPDDRFPMRAGGISLYSGPTPFNSGGKRVFVNIYVVPKGKVKRESITGGTSIEKSPFTLELFTEESDRMGNITSTHFTEDGDVRQVEFRWLRPKEHKGPVILLRFGVGDGGEWRIFTYWRGLRSRPVKQEIGYGGDEEGFNHLWFDQVDKQGTMIIREDISEGNKDSRRLHRWRNGKFQGLYE